MTVSPGCDARIRVSFFFCDLVSRSRRFRVIADEDGKVAANTRNRHVFNEENYIFFFGIGNEKPRKATVNDEQLVGRTWL